MRRSRAVRFRFHRFASNALRIILPSSSRTGLASHIFEVNRTGARKLRRDNGAFPVRQFFTYGFLRPQNDVPLHQIFELANVPRRGVFLKEL
jgi:hypothetical protein